MKNTLLKKGLVLGIIALFIGLAFIPSFNAVSISMLENHPPYIPSNPYPDGPPVDIDVILSWDGGDPDSDDTVTYFVYFDYPHNPPEIIGPYPANQTRIEYDPEGLIYVKNYFWYVIARDNHGLQTVGPIWSFTTIYPNNPPDKPSIKGKLHVEASKTYSYKFKATDPDGDDVRYLINWNDGNIEWTDYYPSEVEIIVNHTFDKTRVATIQARANDTHGALGPWGTIQWSKADKEEDCDCQSNGKTHLADKILNRLEKNEVLSSEINSIKPIDKEDICKTFYLFYWLHYQLVQLYEEKAIENSNNWFLYRLYHNLYLLHMKQKDIPLLFGELFFNCNYNNYNFP